MKKWIVLLGAIAAVAEVGFAVQANTQSISEVAETWFSDTKDTESKQQPAAPSVTVISPKQQSFAETVFVTGTLIARELVLVAPEVAGQRVEKLLVEIGDKIEAGQVLAHLTVSNIEAQHAQAKASHARAIAARAQAEKSVDQAEASERETKAALTRADKLRKSGNISQSIYEQRLSQAQTATARLASASVGLQIADAEIARANAQLQELAWRKSRTEVRAPAAGIISKRNGMVGAMATTEAMFQIIRDGDIELDAEVSAALLTKISLGQSARITLPGDIDVKGRVRLLPPKVERATRLGRVRIKLDEMKTARIGAFAHGRIITARSNALGIPATSVMYQNDGPYVLVVLEGKVAVRKINTGLRANGQIEVRRGLSESDVVVAKSGTFLRSGDPVSPVPAKLTRLSKVK